MAKGLPFLFWCQSFPKIKGGWHGPVCCACTAWLLRQDHLRQTAKNDVGESDAVVGSEALGFLKEVIWDLNLGLYHACSLTQRGWCQSGCLGQQSAGVMTESRAVAQVSVGARCTDRVARCGSPGIWVEKVDGSARGGGP
jgi:hypothetical protein